MSLMQVKVLKVERDETRGWDSRCYSGESIKESDEIKDKDRRKGENHTEAARKSCDEETLTVNALKHNAAVIVAAIKPCEKHLLVLLEWKQHNVLMTGSSLVALWDDSV